MPQSDFQNDPPALEVRGLHKAFGENVAVDHIDLIVPAGSFFGLVGPNGAGKTTSLSMITGLLQPDHGSVCIFGFDMWQEPIAAKSLTGVLPDDLSMPEQLTGRELLTYMGLLRGLDEQTVATRTQELLSALDLLEAEQTLVIEYSRGMRKKIGLGTALLHDSRLLILDEPFEAVDPVSASTIKSILRGYLANGGSILFSSHVMATVEQLCDSVAVISDGEIKASGPIAEVRDGRSLEQRFTELVGGRAIQEHGLTWFTH